MSVQRSYPAALLRWAPFWQPMSRRLGPHAPALALVLVASAIGQLAVLIQTPLVVLVVDSSGYLALTHRILTTGQFTDPLATTGYPTFMALVFLLAGRDNLTAVVVAQTALMIMVVLGIYLLAYRIGLARWAAALIAALGGIDPYIVNFERDIFTETLALWLIVMLFLVFERYLRHGRPATLGWLVVLCTASMLTRPVFIFVPLVLALVIFGRSARRGWLKDTWRAPALALAVSYGLIVVYAGINGITTGYFGLSDVSDFNLWGKLVEYRMYELPVTHADPQALRLRADLLAYVRSGRHDAWDYINQRPVQLKYVVKGHWRVPADLMLAEMHEHPTYYLQRTAQDIVVCDYVAPILYVNSPPFSTPPWIAVLLAFFTFASRVYVLLPLLLIVAGVRACRHPDEVPRLVVFAALAALAGDILITAISDDTDFWRLRVPLDWVMTLVFVAVTIEVVQVLARRLAAWRSTLTG